MLKKVSGFVFFLMLSIVGFVSAQSDGNGFKYFEFSLEEAGKVYPLEKYQQIIHLTKADIQKQIDSNGEGSIWVYHNVYVNYLARMLIAKPNKCIFLINIKGTESLFIKLNDNEYLEFFTGI